MSKNNDSLSCRQSETQVVRDCTNEKQCLPSGSSDKAVVILTMVHASETVERGPPANFKSQEP